MLPTVNLNAIEIFAEGNWNGDKYTGDDLQAIVDSFGHVGFEPTVKAGHADGQDDEAQARRVFGAPALGYVSRVYRQGKKLLADIKQVPRRFAELIRTGAYKRISSEIFWNYRDDSTGRTYPRVLKSIAFLGAEIPALTNLAAVESLYHRAGNGAVFAYQDGREYRIYEFKSSNKIESQEDFSMSNAATPPLGGLTEASKQFAKAALDFAEANGMDYPSAVKYLMREQRRNYEMAGSQPSAASELVGVAKRVQDSLKLPFVDAVLSTAKQHPDLVKRTASDWLIDMGKQMARGRPGFQSENEADGIREALRQYPEVAMAYSRGVLSEGALRTIFAQWFK